MWLLATQQRREEHNALPLVEDGFGRVSVRTTPGVERWLTAILVWRTREVHRVAQPSLSRPLATAGVLGRHARHVVGLVLGEVRLRGGARRFPACHTGHGARHDEVGAEPWCSARRWRRCVSETVDSPRLFVDVGGVYVRQSNAAALAGAQAGFFCAPANSARHRHVHERGAARHLRFLREVPSSCGPGADAARAFSRATRSRERVARQAPGRAAGDVRVVRGDE